MGQRPDLTVVICAYESRRDLEHLLPTLVDQQGPTLEIVVVDNHSQDGVGPWLAATYPEARYLRAPQNQGYGWANNWGLRVASGRYILVLNPDTELADGALSQLFAAAERHPHALVTPKLVCDDGRVNACGLSVHFTGITTCRGLGEDPEGFRGDFSVPAVSGAAIMARRDTWRTLGGFDERYFMYMEEVELSLRARLRGYSLWCAADAVVRHHYALHMTAQKFYWLERNRLLTVAKLYGPERMRQMRAALRLIRLLTFLYAVRQGWEYLDAHRRAGTYMRQHRDELRRERWKSEQTRQVAEAAIFRDMTARLELGQLLPAAANLARLEAWCERLFRRWAPADVEKDPAEASTPSVAQRKAASG
jgi:GT2 family glycosyltransferase